MYHLVLADDSKTIQKVVNLSFAGEDFEIFSFENGASALEHIRRRGADIVLADISLPVLDGYELCRELKEDPRTATLPVVLLASAFNPFDEAKAEGLRIDGALTKPFETSQLVSLVESLISAVEEEQRVLLERRGAVEGDEEHGLLDLSVPETEPLFLFDLKESDCRSAISVLERHRKFSGFQWTEGLSDEQFDLLVGEITRRLPGALRDLIKGISEESQEN